MSDIKNGKVSGNIPNDMEILLKPFADAVNDPVAYTKALSEKGKKVIGYVCSYAPEEIIIASGAHPFRLFSRRTPISKADKHFQSYCCSLVRGVLEEALNGRLDHLYGTVFPHTCDSIQRLSDVFRITFNFDFFADAVLPVKLNTKSAIAYMQDVLDKVKNELGASMGAAISDADLLKAIEKVNAKKRLLKRLYELRSEKPGVLSAKDTYVIVKGTMILDIDEALEALSGLLSALDAAQAEVSAVRRKTLMLIGGICDHPDIYGMLESTGADVTWDDLCTGTRYFLAETPIEMGLSPIESLAKRYAERPVCPAKHQSVNARGDAMTALVKEKDIDGVIFLYLKFCDPHAFDYPYLKEMLDKEKIPSLLYEVEDISPSGGQLLTRIETFVDMI